MTQQRYGVVLFDDAIGKRRNGTARAATDGFAAIDGGRARRIKKVTELESDVKWLTNFEFADFNGNQLGRHPNLFMSGFLRVELKLLCDELGMGPDQMAVDRAAELLSGLFGRTMRIAAQTLKVDLAAEIPKGITKTLAEFIGARFPVTGRIDQKLNEAMERSYQTWNAVMQRPRKDWQSISLRRPRYTHAIDVLSTPVPSNNRWVYLQSARLPASNMDRIDWILASEELPMLANVVIKGRRGGLADLISFSSGASMERSWVSQPELLLLAQYCDVEITGAFVCEDGFQHQKELDAFPSQGDFSLASTSLGLVAENFWASLANPRVNRMGKKVYLPRAIWYRAMDRVLTFVKAAQLKKENFDIFGYGWGNVIAYYPRGATAEIIEAANALGLDVPVSKYRELQTEVRLDADE
ncbi:MULTISPECIES: hypothetical protein [Cupriavidus]